MVSKKIFILISFCFYLCNHLHSQEQKKIDTSFDTIQKVKKIVTTITKGTGGGTNGVSPRFIYTNIIKLNDSNVITYESNRVEQFSGCFFRLRRWEIYSCDALGNIYCLRYHRLFNYIKIKGRTKNGELLKNDKIKGYFYKAEWMDSNER